MSVRNDQYEDEVDFEEAAADYDGAPQGEQPALPGAYSGNGYTAHAAGDYAAGLDEADYEPADYAAQAADPADTDDIFYEDVAPEPARRSNGPIILGSVVGVVVVLGLLLFLFFRGNGGTTGTQTVAGDPGKELPRNGYLSPDFSLQGVNGGTIKLSSYRGQAPVWLNFWATWCQPCRQEMPEMQTLYSEYKNKGVEILGVDVAEDPGVVRDFIKQNNFSWTFALDQSNVVYPKYYSTGIPTHVFIRRDGVISSVIIGGLTKDMMVAELNKIAQ